MNSNLRRFILLPFFAGLLFLPVLPAAQVYNLLANTSDLSGTDVLLSWYINPGSAPYTLGTAQVSAFALEAPGAILGPGVASTSLVTGTLNGAPPLTLSNDYDSLAPATPFVAAEYLLPVTLSASLHFTVSLDMGAFTPGDSGTVFVFSIYSKDADGNPSGTLFTPDGSLGVISWDGENGYVLTPTLTENGQTLLSEFQPAPPPTGDVPEPGTLALLAGGGVLLALLRRRA